MQSKKWRKHRLQSIRSFDWYKTQEVGQWEHMIFVFRCVFMLSILLENWIGTCFKGKNLSKTLYFILKYWVNNAWECKWYWYICVFFGNAVEWSYQGLFYHYWYIAVDFGCCNTSMHCSHETNCNSGWKMHVIMHRLLFMLIL